MINEIMIIDRTKAPRVCVLCMDDTNGDDKTLGVMVKNNPNVTTFHSVHERCLEKLMGAGIEYYNRQNKEKENTNNGRKQSNPKSDN